MTLQTPSYDGYSLYINVTGTNSASDDFIQEYSQIFSLNMAITVAAGNVRVLGASNKWYLFGTTQQLSGAPTLLVKALGIANQWNNISISSNDVRILSYLILNLRSKPTRSTLHQVAQFHSSTQTLLATKPLNRYQWSSFSKRNQTLNSTSMQTTVSSLS